MAKEPSREGIARPWSRPRASRRMLRAQCGQIVPGEVVRMKDGEKLFEEAQRAPSNDAADEVQEREVVLRLLLPTHQDAAEAVHPRVRPLHDPTPRLEPSTLLEDRKSTRLNSSHTV